MNNWKKKEKPCTEADIAHVENQLGIRFPRSFRDMMIEYHGAYAREKDSFDTADEKGSCVFESLCKEYDRQKVKK